MVGGPHGPPPPHMGGGGPPMGGPPGGPQGGPPLGLPPGLPTGLPPEVMSLLGQLQGNHSPGDPIMSQVHQILNTLMVSLISVLGSYSTELK